jgi:hypothetical protein
MSLQCILISFRLFFFAQLRRVLRPMGAFGEVSHQSLPERGLGQAWTRGEHNVVVRAVFDFDFIILSLF